MYGILCQPFCQIFQRIPDLPLTHGPCVWHSSRMGHDEWRPRALAQAVRLVIRHFPGALVLLPPTSAAACPSPAGAAPLSARHKPPAPSLF